MKTKIVAGSLLIGDRPPLKNDFIIKSFGRRWTDKTDNIEYQYAYLFYAPVTKPDSHLGYLR